MSVDLLRRVDLVLAAAVWQLRGRPTGVEPRGWERLVLATIGARIVAIWAQTGRPVRGVERLAGLDHHRLTLLQPESEPKTVPVSASA